MPSRRNTRRPRANKYARFAVAAGNVAKGFKRQWKTANKKYESGVDTKPLYGTAFTSKITYKKRRVNPRKLRTARRKTNAFVAQSMKLQNAQNNLNNGTFLGANSVNLQAWSSYDIANCSLLEDLTSSQLPTGAGRGAIRDFQLWLQHLRLRTTIQNYGTTNCLMDVYYLVPRIDIPYTEMQSPTTTNGNAFANWFVTNTAVGAGQDQLGDTAGDVPVANTVLGYTPFMYQNLTRLFKILRVRTVELGPGQTFVDTDGVHMKKVNPTRFMNTPTTTLGLKTWYLKGISKIVLIGFRGFSNGTQNSPIVNLSYSWEEQSTSKVMQTRASSTVQTIDA